MTSNIVKNKSIGLVSHDTIYDLRTNIADGGNTKFVVSYGLKKPRIEQVSI